MLPILRSRPSRILVALVCALVLSRIPAQVFAEDAISSLVTIESGHTVAVVTADAIVSAHCSSWLAGTSLISLPDDVQSHSITEHAVLRL